MNHIENLKAAIAAVVAQPELDLGNYVTKTDCGTLFCVAGLLPEVPHFQALGVYRSLWGDPMIGLFSENKSLNALFGEFGSFDAYDCLCATRSYGAWDHELLFGFYEDHCRTATDKELALARLNKALTIRQGEQA